MRRRDLSHQELEEVVKRKQSGASWLKIQNETGIPRRAAKRAYEDWERSRSLEELGQVRRDVAKEEFRQHLNHLSILAESLVNHLCVPDSPRTTESSDQVLSRLWHSNIIGESDAEHARVVGTERGTLRIVRQNRLLFKALVDHTRANMRWEALDKWKRGWDDSIGILNELRREAHEVIANILRQKRNLRGRIQEESGQRDAADRLVEAVLRALWWAVQEGKLDQECLLVCIQSDGDETSLVSYFQYPYSRVLFKFADTGLAEEVVNVCNWGIDNLRKGDKSYLVESLQKEVVRMKKAIEELDEMLDPFLLRPMILRTRCDLCPA